MDDTYLDPGGASKAMTDEEKIELGLERLRLLRKKYGDAAHFLAVEQLALGIGKRGFPMQADVVAHVIGNVTEEEWTALVERGARTHGWEATS